MWNIVFYKDRRGKCPPLEFIEELPMTEQAKIRNALRLLQEFGTNLCMPHAKPIQGKLWELRPGGIRLFYFAYIEQHFENKARKHLVARLRLCCGVCMN